MILFLLPKHYLYHSSEEIQKEAKLKILPKLVLGNCYEKSNKPLNVPWKIYRKG